MSKERILDIEVLRAVAVLAVVVHHARGNLLTWTSPGLERLEVYFGGWVGVDLFFAISGFVIGRSLLPQLQASSDSVGAFRVTLAFWIRRAWRLLPSAWLWLALILVASIVFRESDVFGDVRANLEATIAGVLQVANLRFLETFGRGEYGASFVYWTLSLEEQFYLLLPLAVLLLRRWLVPVLLLIVAWQLVTERSLTMMLFRCDGLLLGVLLAIWSRHPTYALARPTFLLRIPAKGTLVLLLVMLFMGMLGSDVLKITSHRMSLLALLSVLMVWLASYNDDVFLFSPLREIFAWLGSRSYAIYLIHIPAFFLTREVWARLAPGQPADDAFFYRYVLTAGLLILLLSELNYRLVETPLRRRGGRIAARFARQEQTGNDTDASGRQRELSA
ncbi:acyltransferase [Pseudomonas sp. PDM16]|uniref:acyltransferase family protein n=1 Tax=Pseudomonas sp. PDM16 TaxID=2769292 RepID=UPI00177E7598|nr:acyltransferase [Pseudomonas sp. PDM16]MBD9413386.1 acyltransferase [Pseudomonas sp. PDM16]